VTGRPKHVLQVIATTDRRGAEVFAIELGDVLRARGASVDTVALAVGVVGGIDVPVLGARPMALSTLRALRRMAKHYDVFIAHGSTTLPACAVSLIGARVLFVYRNIGDPRYWSSTHLRRLRVRTGLRRAAHVVAIAEPARELLIARYGVRRDRCSVIPTAADPERFIPASPADRSAARRELGLPENAMVAATVGALSPEKNVAATIAGLPRRADWHLLVAGDGRERTALEARARCDAPGRVHFLGNVADPCMVYRAADVVVLTSHTEGLPAVLIEAGLSGLPVVTTDVGFVREIVRDGVTGVVVPAGDANALGAALTRAFARRREWGARARRDCVDRFGLGKVAADWDDVLQRLE
jgi:glycosyltransferase involved in cell wall biosynthesis